MSRFLGSGYSDRSCRNSLRHQSPGPDTRGRVFRYYDRTGKVLIVKPLNTRTNNLPFRSRDRSPWNRITLKDKDES